MRKEPSKPMFNLALWLESGAILGVSDDRILLGAGEISRDAHPRSDRASFYAPDFFLTHSKPWISFESYRETTAAELLNELSQMAPTEAPTLQWAPPPRERYEQVFAFLKNEISKGVLEKGVPFTFERATGPFTLAHLLASLKAMLSYAIGRPVIPYGFWQKSSEGILGCTPETLIRRDGKAFRTMALAGTRQHDDHARLPLLEDPKELREHQLVTDSISTELKPFGRVEIGKTEVAILPQLSHLKTPIDLYPEGDVDVEKLIRVLHPTPALGAFPKEPGWKWLQLLEAQNDMPRLRYGAPFGAVWKNSDHQEQGLAVVAIRNIQWQDSRVLLCAGGGVIAESELGREWLELEGKIRAIKGILGL